MSPSCERALELPAASSLGRLRRRWKFGRCETPLGEVSLALASWCAGSAIRRPAESVQATLAPGAHDPDANRRAHRWAARLPRRPKGAERTGIARSGRKGAERTGIARSGRSRRCEPIRDRFAIRLFVVHADSKAPKNTAASAGRSQGDLSRSRWAARVTRVEFSEKRAGERRRWPAGGK
jgi:hypothetical protein